MTSENGITAGPASGDTFLVKLRKRIEALSELPAQFSQCAYTHQHRAHVAFANGYVKLEGAEPAPWYGKPDEMIDAMEKAVIEYRDTLPGPHGLVWREQPFVETSVGRSMVYMRLAFDTVGDPAAREPIPQPIPFEAGDRMEVIVDKHGKRHCINLGPAPQDALGGLDWHVDQKTLETVDDDGKVVRLKPPILGEGATLDPDQILNAHLGRCKRVVVISLSDDDTVDVATSHCAPDTLWLIERGKHELLHNVGDPW